MDKHIAIYARVSSKRQDTRSQEPELKAWAARQPEPVKWYKDKFTGKTMDRPGWQQLDSAIRDGRVSKVVVWRLDRLGRTAKGLVNLFADLQERGVELHSIKDNLDPTTPAGRLMMHVLASVAAYENEVRSERIRAGQAVARAKGVKWGGGVKGRRIKVTPEQITMIRKLKEEGATVVAIAKATSLSRPTVYSVLQSREVAGQA